MPEKKLQTIELVVQGTENNMESIQAVANVNNASNGNCVQNVSAFRARKVALITGVSGQDGSYLAELLLTKGYKVHGMVRWSTSFNRSCFEHLLPSPITDHMDSSFMLHYGDMTDSSSLMKLINQIQPTEVYNLAAQSHVQVSFDLPEYMANVDAMGTLRLLEAIVACGLAQKVRFYQASTSELYGKSQEVPQKETTPFSPCSPYGVAKLFGYWSVINYRHAYGMFSCNGILFIHESPRRGETFVTRKITRSVAKIFLGQQEFVELGNLNAKRDWGHAKDYVEAMWLILQHETPDDFVIATGKTYSVRQFVEYGFSEIGMSIVWEGSGVNEIGREKGTGIVRVRVNAKYFRPHGAEEVIGDATKAKIKLGWEAKISLAEIVKEMVASDIKLMKINPIA